MTFIALLPNLLYGLASHAQESLNPETAETYLAVLRDLDGQVIDVNRAGSEDLQALPWFSPELARGVIAYRKRFGPYQRLGDLLRVPGVTSEILAAVRPYLTVSTRGGPRVRTSLRITRPSSHPDAWSSLRVYQRTVIGVRRMEGVFLTERDPLEVRLADFLTGFVSVTSVPGLRRLLAGDFRPGYGQGLLFSRHNRSATGLEWARPANARSVGNRSAIEDGALRGLFAEGRSGRVTWTAMGARNRWDAAVDSTGIAELRTADLHVTQTQRERRGRLREHLAALRSRVETPAVSIGATFVRTTFTPALQDVRRLHASGMDWDLRVRQMNVFGEIAASGRKTVAWLTGARAGIDRLKLVMLARRYPSGFSSLHGGPFSAYNGRNEWGLFTGAVWRPGRSTRFQATLDRHGRVAPEGRHALPARGERFTFEMRRRLGSARMRLTLGTRRQTVTTSGISGMRHQRRARLRLTVPRSEARLNLWLEGSGAGSPIRKSGGRAAGLDLRVQRGARLRGDAWLALFDVTHFDSRIYTFEPDVWGGSRLQLLSGRGRTAGVRIICKGSRLRVSARYAIKNAGNGTSSTWAAQFEFGTKE
ncbi:MAG: helix-hairpin-helix domain-containing protein [Gemmatimonadota bacterium]|nr:helix-hairpin-helix domain-containing protein [Gemmatimonadota bacterium]